MNRFRLLISNFVVYGIGGIINKIIPFLMLPIITHLLPEASYFGLSDLSNTFVAFGATFCILGMYDTMFRLFFDNDDEQYKIKICSNAFFFVLFLSIIIIGILFFFKQKIAIWYFGNKKYVLLVEISIMTIFSNAVSQILAGPTRIQNKRKVFLVTNTVAPIVSYTIAFGLLKMGIYLYALPMGALISSCITLLIFGILNYKWFSIKKICFKDYGKMLKFALPIVPCFLSYWVFNSTDRVMIARIMGAEANGIYAAASKIGQISQLLYVAFSGGWQYFSFATMKDQDQVELISHVFEYLTVLSCAAGVFMSLGSELIFNILFTEEYLEGASIAPFLFLTSLMLMIYQTANSQFLIIKKTWPETIILGLGAIANIAVNALLIPRIGLEGAALGTIAGYLLSIAIIVAVLKRLKLLKTSWRLCLVTIVFVVYIIFWRNVTINELCKAAVAIILILFYLFLYIDEIRHLCSNVRAGKD